MIIYEIDGKKYPIANKPNEITLNQMGVVARLMQGEDFINNWLDIIEYLGGKKLADRIDDDGLIAYIKEFNIGDLDSKITPSIEIEGKTYKCILNDKGELVLTARELGLISNYVRKEKEWASIIFAIVYKDQSMTSEDNKNEGHIKKKASLFQDSIKGDVAAPVIFQVTRRLIANIDQLTALAKG
jgi:hypothetical protein